jgi:NDP-sugar pyrophosphorylase family protein
MEMVEITEPSFVGRDCVLETGTNLGPFSILSDRVTVKRGAKIRETIVFEQTTLGENCIVEDSIVGEGVTVGRDARIGKGSVIAGQVFIPDGTIVKPGSTILN